MCHGKRLVVILRDTGEGCVTGKGQWSFCVTQVGTCHRKWPVVILHDTGRDMSREMASWSPSTTQCI